MDEKRVYVIVGSGVTKHGIKADMEKEGYPFNFHFDGDKTALEQADEVWVFGDYLNNNDYQYAYDKGLDIWYM